MRHCAIKKVKPSFFNIFRDRAHNEFGQLGDGADVRQQ
jgi:hypothetical protein